MSVNKVILVGRLGQDPEVRYTPSGAAVGNFSVATNEVWNDKAGQKQERTEWHKVVVWGKQAELCRQYLSKGRQVYLEGRLQTKQWQDKDGHTKYTTEVHVQTVQFLGSAQGGANRSQEGGTGAMSGPDQSPPPMSASGAGMSEGPGGPSGGAASFAEDDIPF